MSVWRYISPRYFNSPSTRFTFYFIFQPSRAALFQPPKLSYVPFLQRSYHDDTDMGKDKEKGHNFQLKVPKGTRDWAGADVVLREHIFSEITNVFKKHGGVMLDTPVFELKEVLAGKYGEDSKLIYDLADQGGEICSLRYDLTVPFARWTAMTGLQNIKRYHLAKVYRRDQPAMTKGRMREFYQCDFDIAGQYDPMVPDAEIVKIIADVFESLGWKGGFTIKVNHRKLLDGMFEVCGVPEDKIRTISSAVDKLDKLPWSEVRKEMTEEKGLDPAVADKIGDYVNPTSADQTATFPKGGAIRVLESLKSNTALTGNASAKKGLDDMELLLSYLDIWGVLPTISFDMSLARGLDYYTGVIFETVTEGSAPTSKERAANGAQEDAKKEESKKKKKPVDADEDRSNDPSVGVGSVAAGGRYDGLVSMFSGKGEIPCVGISFGVDRIFSITKARMEKQNDEATKIRPTEVDVYVMSFGGKGCLKERMQVVQQLWDAGIRTEFSYKVKPKLPQQFKAAEHGGIPLAVILGEDELAKGIVKVKEMGLPEGHSEKEGVDVKREDLVAEVRKRLKPVESLASRLGSIQI